MLTSFFVSSYCLPSAQIGPFVNKGGVVGSVKEREHTQKFLRNTYTVDTGYRTRT